MKHNTKALIALTTLGTLLEWAEFAFYGYIAVKISELFFPSHAPYHALFHTFGIFALGFLMRPIGAIVFGHIGDKFGRKKALILSLSLMGCATFSIGLLPTYGQIGLLAPCLLLLLRLCQGMAVSGEYHGAGIFLTEKAGKKHPCLAGSFISASAAGGMVLGCLAAFLVNQPSAPDYAWRIPFLLGGTTCMIGFWLRTKILEENRTAKVKPTKLPFLTVLKTYKKSLLFTGAIAAFTAIYFYVGNIYMVSFLQQQLGMSSHIATINALGAELITMFLIPCMGYWADKSNPYQLYKQSLLCAALASPCLFLLVTTGNTWLIALGMVVFGVSNAAICGPMVKIVYDQFPSHLRYTGISFGWSLSAAIFGGTSPLIAQYFTQQLQWTMGPCLYVSFMALVTYFITQRSLNPVMVLTFFTKDVKI